MSNDWSVVPYEFFPVFINFFVRKYVNFLLSIFTIAHLLCVFYDIIYIIIKYEKMYFEDGGS